MQRTPPPPASKSLSSRLPQAVALALSLCAPLMPNIASAQGRTVPLSTDKALETIQVAPGYRVELAASEPAVVDPVAIRFDEKGRMWVAEMRDYPLGPAPGQPGMSTIRMVEDRDHDGTYETATLFADKLLFVTGLQPWKGGVIVTVSGKVLYLKDTDGDSKADLQELWFEGFSETNSQLRANHPTLTPDGYVYIAGGLRGGMVIDRRPNAASKEPINISGMDFRFDPSGNTAEAVSGAGQFGLTFDDWGNRFVCSNRNPVQQVVFENSDLRRVPQFAVPAVMHDVAKSGEQSRIYAISKAWTTSNLHAGQFTAACGVSIYRGNVLTCDPTGNLIHLENIDRSGSVFTSLPAFENSEFLRSSDDWFRPVSMQVGPDGALYVVDMARAVIEHPEWVPDEQKKRPDERYGDQHGRIWRIVPQEGWKREVPSAAASAVEGLSSTNLWQRETAVRQLLESDLPADAKAALQKALADTTKPALARHLAARLLQSRHALQPADLQLLLADTQHPTLRQLGLRLLGQVPPQDRQPEAIARAAELLKDPAPFVAFTAMITLAGTSKDQFPADALSPATMQHLAALAKEDLFPKTGVLMLAQGDPDAWLSALVDANITPDVLANISPELVRTLAVQVGSKASLEAITPLLVKLLAEGQQKSLVSQGALVGLGQGLARQGKTLADVAASKAELASLLTKKKEKAQAEATSEEQLVPARLLAIDVLSVLPDAANSLTALAKMDAPLLVRQRAITALARQAPLEPWQELLASFASQSPPMRQSIVEGVLSSQPRTSLLLDLMQAGQIKPTELDVTQQNRLLASGDPEIRKRATAIIGSSVGEDRKKALADYQPVLAVTGDPRKGKEVFTKNCSVCHKIGDVGVNVAPDISDSRTKSAAQLLGDILQPNRAIDANFVAYTLVTTDGVTASGILSTETSTSVTLKMQNGKLLTVPRSEVEILKSTGVSLMPEGLERNIPQAEMADLLAFIKNWRYLSGEIPGLGN